MAAFGPGPTAARRACDCHTWKCRAPEERTLSALAAAKPRIMIWFYGKTRTPIKKGVGLGTGHTPA